PVRRRRRRRKPPSPLLTININHQHQPSPTTSSSGAADTGTARRDPEGSAWRPAATMAHEHWKPLSVTHVTYPASSSPLAPLLALLSLAPQVGVCALASSFVFHKDVVSLWLLVGSVASTIVCALLKVVFKQPRPPRYDDGAHAGGGSSTGSEHGMPSNHAVFSWFVAAFVVCYVTRGGGVWAATSLPSRGARVRDTARRGASNGASNGGVPSSSPPSHSRSSATLKALAEPWRRLHEGVAAGASASVAVGCSYSRVYLGYHTTAQVLAGGALGATLGAAWYARFETEGARGALISLDGALDELERARTAGARTCAGSGASSRDEGPKED
ncbi:hypothetical protein ACHAWF_013177, partial [Thalassiosira exigua]